MFYHFLGEEILNHKFYCNQCDTAYEVIAIPSETSSSYRIVLEKREGEKNETTCGNARSK